MKIINYVYRTTRYKVALSVISALAVCWGLVFPGYAAKISKTESAHQHNVKMKAGDTLEIALEGNPTTGYVWERVEGDNVILSPQGDYKYIPAKPLLVGSGGKFVFTFQGVAKGKTKLRIIYHRTFEKNVAPSKLFEVTVIVE